MKREELKALGLTDEQINEVMKVNGTDIEAVKGKTSELETQLATLKTTVAERDTQLETLKKSTGDVDSLKAQITTLQETNTTQATEYQTKMKDLQVSNAIKMALTGKVHDADLVAGLVAKDKLVVNDDGSIIGLDDQIKTLQESKKFLFVPEDTGNQGGTGFKVGNASNENQNPNAALDAAVNAAFGITETK